ncbi:MAG: epoxyqueuosine reductase QueH [Candidatus Omnitrophica bacterium]|nr:epoxyqueuosine reductase QueH [Candidatus Omnitrophota bacterium]MBU4472816.1 epoxyqueuosine reductase QueH [Candidatus Omnitrophota bacterium]
MKLLLHICCAPCLIYPLEKLREKGIEVTGFFYNPNIHPFKEYNNRKQAVIDFSRTVDLEIIYPEYNPAEFFQAVNLKETNLGRCLLCWSLRLIKTARAAKDKGFNSFSTTLLVSPYQDQELLKKIGNDISRVEGTGFYYEDFRPGFRKAHNLAKAQGIYCQDYCGCIYSEVERCKKSGKH